MGGIPVRGGRVPRLKEVIVLDLVSGRLTVVAAARKSGVHVNTVLRWRTKFLEGGRVALAEGASSASHEEARLKAQVAELTHALGEAAAEISSMRRNR